MGDQLSDGLSPGEEPSVRITAGGQLVPDDTGIWSSLSSGFAFLSQYGWYILIAAGVLFYLWSKYKSNYYNWRKKREEWLDEQDFDPVKAERYQDEMMKSREMMQRRLDHAAQLHLAKQEEREKKEQDERIKQWEEFKVINKSKAKKDSHNSGRGRDYLPLGGGGGGGGGGGYRAPRRQVSGGG